MAASPSPTSGDDWRGFPAAFHVAAGLFVACALAVSLLRLSWYGVIMGEDAFLEWLTVTAYLAAGVPLLVRSVRERRPFDALVGLFCLFVAGEEMSWGQRLFGFAPPTVFLERNEQQEFTVHNFGATRTIFAMAMLGYGVVLPLVARTSWGRALMARVGATAPPIGVLPWFIAAVVLVRWDPHRLSGEFGECLAATMFLAAQWPARRAHARREWPLWLGASLAAAALTAVSGLQGRAGVERTACARREAEALAADLVAGALSPSVSARDVGFTRLWIMARRGQVRDKALTRFRGLRCGDDGDDGDEDSDSDARRQYVTDPWQTSYFVGVRPTADGGREVIVYSFGSDRRRNGTIAAGAGDDVMAVARVP